MTKTVRMTSEPDHVQKYVAYHLGQSYNLVLVGSRKYGAAGPESDYDFVVASKEAVVWEDHYELLLTHLATLRRRIVDDVRRFAGRDEYVTHPGVGVGFGSVMATVANGRVAVRFSVPVPPEFPCDVDEEFLNLRGDDRDRARYTYRHVDITAAVVPFPEQPTLAAVRSATFEYERGSEAYAQLRWIRLDRPRGFTVGIAKRVEDVKFHIREATDSLGHKAMRQLCKTEYQGGRKTRHWRVAQGHGPVADNSWDFGTDAIERSRAGEAITTYRPVVSRYALEVLVDNFARYSGKRSVAVLHEEGEAWGNLLKPLEVFMNEAYSWAAAALREGTPIRDPGGEVIESFFVDNCFDCLTVGLDCLVNGIWSYEEPAADPEPSNPWVRAPDRARHLRHPPWPPEFGQPAPHRNPRHVGAIAVALLALCIGLVATVLSVAGGTRVAGSAEKAADQYTVSTEELPPATETTPEARPVTPAGITDQGTAVLRSAIDGLVADANPDSSPTRIQASEQSPYDNAQRWTLGQSDRGTWVFVTAAEFDGDYAMTSGADSYVYFDAADSGGSLIQWSFFDAGEGWYYLANDDGCLTTDGVLRPLTVRQCDGSTGQQWRLDEISLPVGDAVVPRDLSGKVAVLGSGMAELVVDLDQRFPFEGQKVKTATRVEGEIAQEWLFLGPDGDNRWDFETTVSQEQEVAPTMVVRPNADNATNLTEVDGVDHHWTFHDAGDGWYWITDEQGCLTAQGEEAAMTVAKCTGTDNQKWQLLSP
ncbi:RICIN domain-containing protein [Actinophytocola oryzae]|uniref:Uncharacterized protein n=1 Tax=Actinophytocola oryzae TaxID=502181 RepID=A0A4R7VHJ2_9PSEU|nr:RICIN domain-containing protein [Actinophytocola oryzae]TDV48802.1 hypothetical protein CLV71_108162 [Actinophytocola oryzae]